MPSKDWIKVENESGIYRRKKKDDPSKYDYLLVYYLGRTEEYDEKKGKMRQKLNVSNKIFPTLKEAKKFKAEVGRSRGFTTKAADVSRHLYFDECYADFVEYHKDEWSQANMERNASYGKRLVAYFVKTDPRKIDTLDVQDFFRWCREPHDQFPQALSNSTIQKIQIYMGQIWKWWKLDRDKFGNIDPNVIKDADHGKIDRFVPNTWKLDEMLDCLDYVLKNEEDYSRIALIGLAGFAAMRRGEIAGLKWGDILWSRNLIDIQRQRTQRNHGYEVLDHLKRGDPDGKTRAERKQRYTAMSNQLADMLRLVYRQQAFYTGKKPTADDYVYRVRTELVNDYLGNPRHIDDAFQELQKRMNKMRVLQGKEVLPRLRLHDLRHSNISALLNDGISILEVAANSGHKFDELHKVTTTKVYWHDNEDRTSIIEYWNTHMPDKIETPDQNGFKAPNLDTNRRNLRSDEM